MKLGFDLDEVVVDLTAEFTLYLESTYGLEWPIDCFVDYNFAKCAFTSDDELNKEIAKDMVRVANDPNFQDNAKPMPGAVRTLQELKKTGHKLYFITARPKQNQPYTFRWLRKNNIPFDGLEVIGQEEEKGVYGRRLNLDMFVDDLESHLESMYRHKNRWKKGLVLYTRPWNVGAYDATRFVRVDNWKQIIRHVGIQNR
jgi:uncharacterized HAD superfamily protein